MSTYHDYLFKNKQKAQMARTFFHFEWFPLSTPYTANSPSLETRAASNMRRSDWASEAKLM